MQRLSELSVEAALKQIPVCVQEQLFDAYVKRLYLPQIKRLDNIFYDFYEDADVKDFDKVVADFAKTFPEFVHTTDHTINTLYQRKDRRFYFQNRQVKINEEMQPEQQTNVFYLAIETPVDWKVNNQIIDFFVQRNLPVWPGLVLPWYH